MVFVCLATNLFSQSDQQLIRKKIDSTVKEIDKADGKIENFWYGSEYYEWKTKDSVMVKMICSFKSDSKTVTKKFYCTNKQGLIFSTEKEVTYYGSDSVTWAGKYYFRIKKLIDYETLGHGKSETEEWEPEKEVLISYYKIINNITHFTLNKPDKINSGN